MGEGGRHSANVVIAIVHHVMRGVGGLARLILAAQEHHFAAKTLVLLLKFLFVLLGAAPLGLLLNHGLEAFAKNFVVVLQSVLLLLQRL